MKSMSLRVKLAIYSAGLSGLVLIAFGALAWAAVYQERLAAVDREIKALVTRHPGLFAGRGSIERLESSLAFTYGEEHTNEVFLVVKNAGGEPIYELPQNSARLLTHGGADSQSEGMGLSGSTAATNAEIAQQQSSSPAWQGKGRGGFGRGGPPAQVAFSAEKFETVRSGSAVWRVGIMKSDGLELAIGLNLRAVHAELDRVRTMFILILPAALLLIAVTGWMIAGRALRPLDSIAETAEAVTARGLDRRIPVSAESPEIQRVITLLNGMMDRLETSFRQATRFSADASHELKTPLAIMQGELEFALQECEPGSAQQRLCSRLLDTVQQLKTITRSLLVLAQADAGHLKLTKEEVNLSDELGDFLEDAYVLAGDKNLVFESHVQPGLIVQADRALLKMAVFNLLNNSVKYSDEDGKIRVELSHTGDLITLMIGNSGPGIPTEEQEKIFTRFHRARREGDTPVDGLGLGLSLAREIVRAHGGDLKLLESRSGWTVFQLGIPTR
jgi:signal transduction histidine kinase